MQARQIHRGTMTLGGLLIAYWVISGLTIAIVDATDPHQGWASMGGGPGARLNDGLAASRPVPSPTILASGIQKSFREAANRDLAVAGVDYRMIGDTPRLELSAADGSRDTELRFYAATGEAMTEQVADADFLRSSQFIISLRERIKSYHKGDAWGLPVQILGLITGILLTVMILSGAILYLSVWRARIKAGRPAFFWKSRESKWRRVHRYVAIVAAILILNKAVTGTILAWGEIQVKLAINRILPFPYPMPTPLPPYSENSLPGDLLRGLETSYAAAREAAPAEPIVAIELVQRDQRAKGLVTLGGSQSRTLSFDMLTGAVVDDSARLGIQVGNGYFADWHQVLKRMHRGDIIGHFAGRYGDIACGLALLYLVTSGFVLYTQLWKARALAGRRDLFWK